MSPPSDERGLDLTPLAPEHPGDAPEAFLDAVRQRRRSVVRTRLGISAAGIGLALVALAVMTGPPAPGPSPDPTPIVIDDSPRPRAPTGSLAALVRTWNDEGDLPMASAEPRRDGEALSPRDADLLLRSPL